MNNYWTKRRELIDGYADELRGNFVVEVKEGEGISPNGIAVVEGRGWKTWKRGPLTKQDCERIDSEIQAYAEMMVDRYLKEALYDLQNESHACQGEGQ